MNIESQALNVSGKTTETKQKVSNTSSQNLSSDVNSFKNELNSIDSKEQKAEQEMSTSINQNTAQSNDAKSSSTGVQKVVAGNNQTVSKGSDTKSFQDELGLIGGVDSNEELIVSNTDMSFGTSNILGLNGRKGANLLEPLNDLKSEIATVRDLKSRSLKISDTCIDELEDSLSINVLTMDQNDSLFFAHLVNGDTLSAKQNGMGNFDFSEIKSEAAQASSRLSATLAGALSESMKTNKPFRIDFDNNIAVIMRVDKEGKLSAEFIPGDKAVEQYLRNNIPLLKERFEQQSLPCGDLSYQRQKQHNQENNNSKQHKENANE